MIGKLQNDVIKSVGISEKDQAQPEQTAEVRERTQSQSSTTVVQESKLAYGKMNESAFSSSMQRAKLDAALIVAPETAPETPAPIGTTPPDAEGMVLPGRS